MEIPNEIVNNLVRINNAISELIGNKILDFSYAIQLLLDESNELLGEYVN